MKTVLFASLSLAALVVIATLVIPSWNYAIWGYDFHLFYQAATALRTGQNPYLYDFHDSVYSFHNPIYSAVIFLPLSLLPERTAMMVNAGLAAGAVWLVFQRLSRSALTASLALLSRPVFMILLTGNADWLPLLAAITPPMVGIWLALIKPQVGIVLAVLYGCEIWRQSKRRFALTCGALAALLTLSLLLGMRWQSMIAIQWNWSLFPVGVPVGLFLIWQAWRRKNDRALALAAAPFLSPYVASQSWAAAFPWLTRWRWLLLAAVVITWLV
jgi:hypothetical protein